MNAILKRILKEIDTQLTTCKSHHLAHSPLALEGNKVWRQTFIPSSIINEENTVKSDDGIIGEEMTFRFMTERDASDFLTFLESTRKHKELIELYFPFQNVSELHKVEKAAKMVGLNLPKSIMGDNELPEGLGDSEELRKQQVG